MPVSKPPPESARRLAAIAAEPLRIGREMVVIPLQIWMVIAELAGRVVLAGWYLLRPVLVAALIAAGALLRLGEQVVTPGRAAVVAALAAAIALGASQWSDYHEVSVGTAQYSGVEQIAPPPPVERERAGDAHSWAMIPIAAAALVATIAAALGRRRVALVLLPLGLLAIAIALIVDVPQGLDEGSAALAYEGARASLLDGFWAQIAAAAVLSVCGVLLPAALRRTEPRLKPRRRSPDRGREGMRIAEATHG
jgi:hypothetical protein